MRGPIMNTKRCQRMGTVALAVPATTFAATASHADAIGDPMSVVGKGHFGVAVGAMHVPRVISVNEYLTTGYYMKVQGSVLPWTDLYLRVGSERLTIPATPGNTEFHGDSGIAVGGGAKIALPAIPLFGLSHYVDVSARGFHSKGTMTVPVPSTMDLENLYDWREYQAGYGICRNQRLFSPYGGVTATLVRSEVTHTQLTGTPTPLPKDEIRKTIYAGFVGIELHLSPGVSFHAEATHDRLSGPGYSFAIGEVMK